MGSFRAIRSRCCTPLTWWQSLLLLVFRIEEKTAIIHWVSGCLLFLKINTGIEAYKTTFPEIFPRQIFNINFLHVDDILVLDAYRLILNITSDKLNFGWKKCTPLLLSQLNTYATVFWKKGKMLFLGQGPFHTLQAKLKLDPAYPRRLTSSQVKSKSLADMFGIFQVDSTILLDQGRGWLHDRFPSAYAASESWAPRSGLTKHQPINFIRKQREWDIAISSKTIS